MKDQDCTEGTQAFDRFKAAMQGVVKVPAETIRERVEEHRREAAKNPNRRGPKPKNRS